MNISSYPGGGKWSGFGFGWCWLLKGSIGPNGSNRAPGTIPTIEIESIFYTIYGNWI